MGIEEICSIVWTFFLEHKIIAGFIIIMIGAGISGENENRTEARNAHDRSMMAREKDLKKINAIKDKIDNRTLQTYEESTKYNVIAIFGIVWMLIGFYQWATAMNNI